MMQEFIQDYIDHKQWDELINTSFMEDMLYSRETVNYNITPSLIEDFFLDKTRREDALQAINNKMMIPPEQSKITSLMSYLDSLMQELNIEISVKAWNNWFDYIFNDLSLSNVYKRINLLSLTNKSPNYVRFFLKNPKAYKDLCKFANAFSGTNRIDKRLIDGLSKKEKYSLGHILTYEGALDVEAEYPMIFYELYPSQDELLDFSLREENILKIKVGKILRYLKYDDFIKIYKRRTPLYPSNAYLVAMGQYFKFNENYPIPNDILKDYMVKRGVALKTVINNMSPEQIEENKEELSVRDLAQSNNISLDDITRMKGVSLVDLSSTKLFKLEEIKKNPHFFDPKSFQNGAWQYITEDVFELLKKTWGVRKPKWSSDLTDFDKIITTNLYDLSIEMLKYYKEVMNVTNKQLFNCIRRLNSFKSPDLEKLTKLARIYKKFS